MPELGLIALTVILSTVGTWFWRAWRVNIPTTTPKIFIGLWGVGFALGIVALYRGSGDPFAPWAVGLGALMLYLIFTGAQKVADTMVEVGDVLPAFTTTDDKGESFDSASLAGSRVLFKFFRGHW